MTLFAVPPAGDELLADAQIIIRHASTIPAAPESVWRALTADDALVSWGPIATAMEWKGERPLGVGTRRIVTLARLISTREHFYRWEPGRRKSFYVVAATLPGIRGMVEDYLVEPVGSCTTFTWTVAINPAPAAAPALLATKPLLHRAIASLSGGLSWRVLSEIATNPNHQEP